MADRRISGATQYHDQMVKTRKYEKLWKKIWFFPKMKVMVPYGAKNISTVGSHCACASFVYTSQPWALLFLMAKCKKPEFRSLSTDLGYFPTSDVILIENFCRLASIWLIDLMKLFALGRIDSAVGYKFRLAGKVAKFTEMAIITLRRKFSRKGQAVLVGVVCVDVWCS